MHAWPQRLGELGIIRDRDGAAALRDQEPNIEARRWIKATKALGMGCGEISACVWHTSWNPLRVSGPPPPPSQRRSRRPPPPIPGPGKRGPGSATGSPCRCLDNATSYSPTAVTVSAYLLENGSVLFRIEDSGIGIPPAQLALLNAALAGPVPDVNDRTGKHTGFSVMHRLARKHGIGVRFASRTT